MAINIDGAMQTGIANVEKHDMSPVRYLFLLVCLLLIAGCNQMRDQPKLEPFEASAFFVDGMSARPFVPNTVARGQLRADDHLYRGQAEGRPANSFPFPITEEILAKGQERYDIYCSPCHGHAGYGDGIIVQRGFTAPPSLHTERMRALPPGHIFDVITNGIGAMYAYGDRTTPEERWAIIAYMEALQLSQNATPEDVPPDQQAALDAAAGVVTGTAPMIMPVAPAVSAGPAQ